MPLSNVVMLACSLLFSTKISLVNSFLPSRTIAPETLSPMITPLWPTYTTHQPTPRSPVGEITRSQGLSTEACQRVNGLTQKQKAVCAESPALIPVIVQGIKKAISECQQQFRSRRWNCSSFEVNVVFGKKRKPQLPGTKERAVIHAIASAGVVDVVAKSCYNGNLTACGMCPVGVRNIGPNNAYQWGLCSDNIVLSATFAKRMLDARENSYTPLSALNLHNNEVGRETTYELASKTCRCHGQSASCSVQTCWHAFPTFDKVARKLAMKYDMALLAVEFRKRSGLFKLVEADQPSKRLVNHRQKGGINRDQEVTQLYYLKESPSYCDPDPTRGSLGTRGRRCTLSGDKWENCEFLCCGRGYRTETFETIVDCNCTFKFCCYVQCEKCPEIQHHHYCL
ncbi:protein Wnt-4-like isoform X1 [Bolinopsis microptera]|uniref:protein Wnt-4-like isoform X1 n=1 Tax=Bolinopsis microptera TaxID=2820187 RepID=UPI003079E204